jgi:hypothetical protein
MWWFCQAVHKRLYWRIWGQDPRWMKKVQYMYACIMHHIDRLYVIRIEIHFYMEGNKALNAEGPLTATKPQENVVNRVKLSRIEWICYSGSCQDSSLHPSSGAKNISTGVFNIPHFIIASIQMKASHSCTKLCIWPISMEKLNPSWTVLVGVLWCHAQH